MSIFNGAQRFVDSVAEYANNVLKLCHDKYGDKETPLLTDGIYFKTGEPAKWEEYVISNLACQQNFLRTLDGLSALTGEPKYQEFARQWIGYALNELQDSASGMLYWGGHANYDLINNKPLVGNHELKCVYPYYSYLYGVNSEAASFLMEGIWHKHVKDWSSLLFNRHGEYSGWDREAAWEHEYSGGPLPIIDNTMLSFINTGSDLIYAGSILAKLSDNGKPLLWAKRLLNRYDEVRNEKTGLGGYQFNHRDPCRVRISFKKPWSHREDVNETTVLKNGVIQTRYGKAAIVWLNLFEELGAAEGQEFLDFTVKDLTAIGEHAYDFSDHSFTPLLVDGTKLQPSDCVEGAGYCSPRSLEKMPASGLMFLVHAKAYRITGEKFFWKMARNLAQGLGWEEIFDATDEQSAELQTAITEGYQTPIAHQDNISSLLGLMELYRATDQKDYLSLAISHGNQLVQTYFTDGFFTTGGKSSSSYASIDSPLPLALLQLAAAAGHEAVDLPTFYPNSTSFDPKVIIARRKRAQ